MDRLGYGYCTPKTDSHKEEKLKIRSWKQVIVNNMQFYRKVTVRQKKKTS